MSLFIYLLTASVPIYFHCMQKSSILPRGVYCDFSVLYDCCLSDCDPSGKAEGKLCDFNVIYVTLYNKNYPSTIDRALCYLIVSHKIEIVPHKPKQAFTVIRVKQNSRFKKWRLLNPFK